MKITEENLFIANALRALIQKETKTIGDGEAVSMILLYAFCADHAEVHSLDLDDLIRGQLEAFLEFARDNVHMVQTH